MKIVGRGIRWIEGHCMKRQWWFCKKAKLEVNWTFW